MPRAALAPLFALAVLGTALAGCSGARALTPDDFRERLPGLEAAAASGPDDAPAQRDLGEAYAQTGRLDRALAPLERARALDPADPKTRYYLGLVYDDLGRPADALAALGGWSGVPPTSPWRRLMAGRHTTLQRAILREELAALLAAEDSLAAAGAAAEEVTDAVAVFPFAYRGGDPQWAPLGRGLAEMLTADLAAIPEITVVERLRLQTLLDEMGLAGGGAFDPATAPRAGRLLRVGQIVGGGLDAGGDRLSADVALWDWPTGDAPSFTPHEGALEDLFEIKRQMAFGVVERLGIALTPEQRERIERPPTRSLLAFLAFSRGLVEEDAGRYAAATEQYRQAVRLDPRFAQAASRADAAAAAELSGGTVEAGLRAVASNGASDDPDGEATLLQRRLRELNGSVGGQILPGEEGRVPTAEVPLGPDRTPIPDPPPPPR